MTKIYQVAGLDDAANIQAIGCPPPGTQKLFTLMGYDVGEISEGELDLLIARDNMVTKRNIVAELKGIGSVKAQKFQNSIDVLDDAIDALTLEDPVAHMAAIEEDILSGVYGIHDEVAGIGSADYIGKIRKARAQNRRANRIKRVAGEAINGIGKAKKAAAPKTKTGGFIKKAAQKVAPALKKVATKTASAAKKTGGAIKKAGHTAGKAVKKAAQATGKGVKKVTRVVTTPARLVTKAILEVTLPKASPFFMYLFINDPAIIAKLPAKVKRKRDRQLKIKNFIVNTIGMKDAHFMGIVRNGIMKQRKASPETILSKQLGMKVSGIGVATVAAEFVFEIIAKLVQAFKKNKSDAPVASADDAPGDEDFAEMSSDQKTDLSSEIKKQNDIPEPAEERSESATNAQAGESPANPAEIKKFQSWFNKNKGGKLAVDGKFGPQTSKAWASAGAEFQGSDTGSSDSGGSSSSGGNSSSSSSSAGGKEKNTTGGETSAGGGKEDAGGESETASSEPTAPANKNDTDANGEIKKQEPFATGGRKEWNSLGGKK